MSYLSKIRIVGVLVIAFASLTTITTAQERSAGGPVDTQMTWSALSSLVNAANAKSDAVNSRVDQVVVCAKKGKVYAPGQSGVDGQGCLEATISPTIINTINTTKTDVTNINTCGESGKVYNKTTNACVTQDVTIKALGTPVNFSMNTTNNKSGTLGSYAIPKGTSFIIANMSCSVYGSEAIIDSNIAFNNPGGYPANKLCYLGGVSSNNTANIMDTKYIPVPKGATTFLVNYAATNVDKTTRLNGTMTFMGN